MKILVIRFMGLGDVASILLPAVKLIKQQMPDAEVDVLTFGAGIELMQMVPQVHAVLGVTQEQWPGDLLPAVQSFVGIGEVVLAQGTSDHTFVFDEVDAGVGGKAAVELGRRLARCQLHAEINVEAGIRRAAKQRVARAVGRVGGNFGKAALHHFDNAAFG